MVIKGTGWDGKDIMPKGWTWEGWCVYWTEFIRDERMAGREGTGDGFAYIGV